MDEDNNNDFQNKMKEIANSLSNDSIEQLLSYQFQALMLLEENPNNKWVLPKKEED